MKQIVNDNDDFPNSQIMFSIQWYQICLTKKKKKIPLLNQSFLRNPKCVMGTFMNFRTFAT